MLTKTDILNGGGYPDTYWEFSNYFEHNGGYQATKTAWENGRPVLTYNGKPLFASSHSFTQNKALADKFGINYVDMNAPDSAALGDLAELQADAAAKTAYLGSDTAVWGSKDAYAGALAETKEEIQAFNTTAAQLLATSPDQAAQAAGIDIIKKPAGLNPLIVVAGVAAVGLAALALRGK